MITCKYLLACERAIEDKQSSLWTLVNLAERIEVELLGIKVPMHIVSQWSFDKELVGKSLEYQVILRDAVGFDAPSKVHTAKVNGRAQTIRSIGLETPKKKGVYKLFARVRIPDSEWTESPFWVIEFDSPQKKTAKTKTKTQPK